jgi:hypothetical protein
MRARSRPLRVRVRAGKRRSAGTTRHQNGGALSTQIHLLAGFSFDSKFIGQHATTTDPWARKQPAQTPSRPAHNGHRLHGRPATRDVGEPEPARCKTGDQERAPEDHPVGGGPTAAVAAGDSDLALGLGLSDVQRLMNERGMKIIAGASVEQPRPARQPDRLPLHAELDQVEGPPDTHSPAAQRLFICLRCWSMRISAWRPSPASTATKISSCSWWAWRNNSDLTISRKP